MPSRQTPVYKLDNDYCLKLVEDVNDLESLFILMHKESPYNQYTMRKDIVNTLTGIVIGLYCKEELVGFLAATVVDNPLVELRMAFEQGFFVHPEHRKKHSLKLIEAYEYWARTENVQAIQMCHMNTDRLDAVYEKFGFKLHEKVFLKCLH